MSASSGSNLANVLKIAGLVVALLLLVLYVFRSEAQQSVVALNVFTTDVVGGGSKTSMAEPGTHSLVSAYTDSCTTGFEDDPALQQRYESMCSYWEGRVAKWKQRIRENNADDDEMMVDQIRNGAGDRLMGSLSAFDLALGHQKRVNFFWENLDHVFAPSCALAQDSYNDKPFFGITGYGKDRPKWGCKKRSFYKCGLEAHTYDKCPIYNRACLSASRCMDLTKVESMPTMAHVVGCPLRMMFAPRLSFLEFPLTWFINGAYVNGTLTELLDQMREYNVIAVHGRMGDSAFKLPVKQAKKQFQPIVDDFLRCTNLVNKYQASQTNKTTRFLVASDDESMKQTFLEKYPKKVILIKLRPQHVIREAKLKSESHKVKALQQLFAEWYAIGKADQLITNNAHSFGVSSFSRSAWLYNLKSQFYELRTLHKFCFLHEYGYDGNANLIHGACKGDNPLMKSGAGPPQLHSNSN